MIIFDFSFQFLSLVVCAIIMMGVANPWLFLVIVPLVVVFFYARSYYMATARDVKRIEVAGKSL